VHDLSLGDVLKVFSVLWITDKRNVSKPGPHVPIFLVFLNFIFFPYLIC